MIRKVIPPNKTQLLVKNLVGITFAEFKKKLEDDNVELKDSKEYKSASEQYEQMKKDKDEQLADFNKNHPEVYTQWMKEDEDKKKTNLLKKTGEQEGSKRQTSDEKPNEKPKRKKVVESEEDKKILIDINLLSKPTKVLDDKDETILAIKAIIVETLVKFLAEWNVDETHRLFDDLNALEKDLFSLINFID